MADGIWVVSFWATWCGPCIVELPLLNSLRADLDRAGAKLALLQTLDGRDGQGVLASFDGLRDRNWDDPDGVVAAAFGVSGFPTTIVIRDGKIVWSLVGELGEEGSIEMLKSVQR